jgi:hypothetical protein
MIRASELRRYTPIDLKLEKFFRKLETKVKKKALGNTSSFSVVIYDTFVPELGVFTTMQQHNFHDSLFEDWIFQDAEVFAPNIRSEYMRTIQQRLLHDFGYSQVSWTDFAHPQIYNAIRLHFGW